MDAVYRADWVVPVAQPPIRGGAVVVRGGRIVDVDAGERSDQGERIDLGQAALFPGFVNPHTHLELTGYHGRVAPMPFWDWLPRIVELRAAAHADIETDGVLQGGRRSLRAGVTLVGDISRPHQAWPILRALPLRKVCFAELISYARRPARTPHELWDLVEATPTDDRLHVGVSPHAPYTVYPQHFADVVAAARQRRAPITTHLAETTEEVEFCTKDSGRLCAYLAALGQRDAVPSPGTTPVEYLHRLGALALPILLAHVNYIDDQSLELLAHSQASVVYCPRAHAYFGHARHRFRDMLRAGINVALGTDSAASLPADDAYEPLSVLDEARFLHAKHPDVPPELLIRMITVHGAAALGMEAHCGTITPGRRADLVAVPLTPGGSDDPLRNVLESQSQPTTIVIDGQTVDPHKMR